MLISLVLLLKNGGKFLPEMLSILSKQKKIESIELVVVDSGSKDDGLKFLEKLQDGLKNKKEQKELGIIERIEIFKIKPSEFNHAATRNFAVRHCAGEIVVFLTQDALPQSKEWLFDLTRPFRDDEKLAGVFGRQIPRPNTNLVEKYFYTESYPATRRVMDKKDSEFFSNRNIFFSNVNGAVRKDLLWKFPFRKDLLMSEDQFWGREVLRNGYKIMYLPQAEVVHSHNYNLFQLFKRYYQSGYSQRQMGLKGDYMKNGGATVLGLLWYVLKNRPILLPYAILYTLVKGGAFLLGRTGFLKK